jgi:protein-disulfide isomerase
VSAIQLVVEAAAGETRMNDHDRDRRLLIGALLMTSLAGCSQAATKTAASVPSDMDLGNRKAAITVVEYASVACPVCGRWYKEVYPAFKAKYIDTSKVHFIYREMLVGSREEMLAAAAGFLLARCAGKDRYFKIVDAVYNSQPALFDDPRGVLLKIAKGAGFSEDQFDACVKDDASIQALSKRVEANAKIDNVNATPTFVVNGKSLEPGYHSLADLDVAIAAAR